jgi:hypothetical protein
MTDDGRRMQYKFEKLEVWKLAMKYNELVYELTNQLPKSEKFNLNSQMRRASTSIALNIAGALPGKPMQNRQGFYLFPLDLTLKLLHV